MLPRHQRLTNGRDFQRVYQKGSFFAMQALSINWLPNKTSQTRIGFVAGKKVAAKATERNSVKRKFREAVRGVYSEIPKGYDVVIVIKGGAKNIDFDKITEEIKKAITKIRVKNEKNSN